MSEDEPDFICPSCGWQGDDTDCIICECGRMLCKKCFATMVDFEEYQNAQAAAAREDELEDKRLFGE